MSATVRYMSLDGFMAGPDNDLDFMVDDPQLADGWGGDHHDGVPIFVLTRREPGSETGQWPLITYVTDVRTAMTEAKQAAGDKDVLVHGAGTPQLVLAAGVLDELEIHLIPVLLGQGRRLLLFAYAPRSGHYRYGYVHWSLHVADDFQGSNRQHTE